MRPRSLLALAAGHFLGDSYGSFLAALLPALMVRHGLDLKQAGLLAAALALSNHFLQPAWGYVADRYPGRRFALFGPLVMALCISSIGLAPSPTAVAALLVIGGCGMASFHPEAARLAREASGAREAFGMSLFISSGNLGFSVGPAMATSLVAIFGLPGTALAVLPGLCGVLLAHRWIPTPTPREHRAVRLTPELRGLPGASLGSLTSLFAISLLRALVSIGFLTFLPVLFASRGFSLQQGGLLVSSFLLAGAAGGLTGGYLADRWGSRPVMFVTLIVAAPLLWLAVRSTGPGQALALVSGGALLVASHPVNVSLAQSIVPARAGTVAAFMIGVAFGSSGLLMPLLGSAADAYGVGAVLSWIAAAPFAAAVLVLTLKAAVSRRVVEWSSSYNVPGESP